MEAKTWSKLSGRKRPTQSSPKLESEAVGLELADIIHDRGFFVGNHPRDLRAELTLLREVLDEAVVATGASPLTPAQRRP